MARAPARLGALRAPVSPGIWTGHGVAGLVLAAPLLVGAQLGTVLGLVLGAQPSQLLRWMVFGVVGWSALLTSVTEAGLVGLESLD